jgi:hypothetical protein
MTSIKSQSQLKSTMFFIDFSDLLSLNSFFWGKRFHYFSTKGYSPFSKAEYPILIQNLLLRMGIAKVDFRLFHNKVL